MAVRVCRTALENGRRGRGLVKAKQMKTSGCDAETGSVDKDSTRDVPGVKDYQQACGCDADTGSGRGDAQRDVMGVAEN